ncbi:MAG: hypothetical protein P4L87_26320 [Formivibrio sp.]|nr:hypothetical protein [Formivibrio sp.]
MTILDEVLAFGTDARGRWRLLFLLATVFVAVSIVLYILAPRTYSASALIGPPEPTTADTLMGTSSSSTNSVARRLLGGGSATTNDHFQEYLQVLRSVRLANVLMERDHLLQIVYAARWDAQNHRWRPQGGLHVIISKIKGLIGLPVKDVPDVDDLKLFLDKSLRTSASSVQPTTLLTSTASSYWNVSLTYGDRETAEKILDLVLFEADQIIRDDMRRDVSARLVFLATEMPKVNASDQRDALIATLSGQEQLQMLLQADKRFASTLIDPPYAPSKPTQPGSPIGRIISALFAAFLSWAALIYLSKMYGPLRTIIDRIDRSQA